MADITWDLEIQLPSRKLAFRLRSSAHTVGVCGPSGCGKSTLLRCMAGLEPRAQGTVDIQGRQLSRGDSGLPTWERRLGWVPQDPTLFPAATVAANLAWAAPPGSNVGEVAHQLGLEHLLQRMPRNLSGGERQRTALGRALLSRPAALLLDEPFSALDRAWRQRCAELLRSSIGMPMMVVTHSAQDLQDLAAETWEMGEGGSLQRLANLSA